MSKLLTSMILVFAPFLALKAQTEDFLKAKIIFAVNRQNPYILMDDTLVVQNGKIFDTDTGEHFVKIWAPKQEVLDTSIIVKTGVHLNRQFFVLEKRRDLIKRRNNDILVASIVGLSVPILFTIDTRFQAFDLQPYEAAIAEAEADIAGGNSGAASDLQVARENYQFVKDRNDEERKKAEFRKNVVTGVVIAELAGLTTYLIYRALGPKLKRENPLLSDLQIGPLFGLNHTGMCIGFKF